MPPVTLAAVVDLTKVKMKWKEIYVSEGLNRKVIPSTPKGIYSGLRLIQNISSPRQVEVSASPDDTHAAVHQSSTGFSTTYHDNAGVSTILDLNSVSLDNQETVITLSIMYTIGADTTANWIAYPIADWNLLTDAQRAERIVLGTINVPAAATNVTTAMITPNRRTVAWDSAAPGAVAWTPVVKNGDFEYSLDEGTFRYAASYWQYSTHANGRWKVQSVDPHSGVRALAFDQVVAAAPVIWIDQYVGIPAVAGQLIKYRLRVKSLMVPTGGALTLDFLFADNTFGAGVSTAVPIAMAGIDASYRLIEGVVAAPATASQLYSVRFTNLLNQGTTGIAFRLDDVQVWVETGVARKAPSAEEQTRQQLNTQSLIVESGGDPTADYFGPAALLSMPVDNELWLARRDGNTTTENPIQLALRTARMTQLGADLLNTEARALLPRIEAPVSTTAGVDFTLMWQSVPSGQVGYRKYVSASGEIVETINAIWSGTTWSKDVGGVAALKDTMTIVAQPQRIIHVRNAANNAPWADGSWDQDPFNFNFGAAPLFEIVASMNIFGDLWLSNGAHITLNGTGKYKRGTRIRHISPTTGTVVSTPNGNHDYFALTGYVFTKVNGDRFGIPIYLEEGEQLTQVVGHVRNGAGDTVAMRVFRDSVTVGSGTLGTTQLGATQTSVGVGSVFEALTVTGLTETVGATNVVYWAEYRVTAFSGGPILAGLQVTTTVP